MEDRFGERAVVELGYTNAPEVPRLAAAFEAGPHFAGKLRDFINYLQDLEGPTGKTGRSSRASLRACVTFGGSSSCFRR